jgi:hypothetical protein
MDNLNFGNWRPGSIQGACWHDKNLDGKRNDESALKDGRSI